MNDIKDMFYTALKIAFQTITPWKKRMYGDFENHSEVRYMEGWNDCIKTIRKNRKEYLTKLKTELPMKLQIFK